MHTYQNDFVWQTWIIQSNNGEATYPNCMPDCMSLDQGKIRTHCPQDSLPELNNYRYFAHKAPEFLIMDTIEKGDDTGIVKSKNLMQNINFSRNG